MYLTFLLKIVELSETVFFVLRRKHGQISKLHVYHHASTALLSWVMVKYVGGGMILFSVVLNSCVHIIMYSYYFAALFGPRVQHRLEPIKRRITLIQMVGICVIHFCVYGKRDNERFSPYAQIQFCLIIVQCCLALYNDCDMPRMLVYIYIPNVLFIFYMFYKFFNRAYANKE